MKKLSLLFAFISTVVSIHATHLGGGQISYRYLGDSSGIPNHYEITLDFYSECSATPITPGYDSLTIEVKSSCYPTLYVWLLTSTVPPRGINPFTTYYTCIDSTNAPCLMYKRYKGAVVLPGLCSDFNFNYSSCCRNSGIDNLINSTSQSFYVATTLNNFINTNSSVAFGSDPVRTACIGRPITWHLTYSDVNADSLRFTITAVRGLNGSALAYAPGYSIAQPIKTTLQGSVIIHPKTGAISFTPNVAQQCLFGVLIEEFTFDSTYFMWVNVASTLRELFVVVQNTCKPTAQALYLDYNSPGIFVDPLTGLPAKEQACLDSVLIVPFATLVDLNSIALDGSDFRLAKPNGQPIPIKSASAVAPVMGFTQHIALTLFSPLNANGTYILYSKMGNDGNTLTNACGFSMYENDTILVKVTDCSGFAIPENTKHLAPFVPSSYSAGQDFIIKIPENLQGEYTLSFYSMQGALLFTETFSSSGLWDVQQITHITKQGIYVCRLQNAKKPGQHWQQKVLVTP